MTSTSPSVEHASLTVIPRELAEGPVTSRQVQELGLSPYQLTGGLWSRPFGDVFMWVGLRDSPGIRARALGLVLPPRQAAVGLTAAWVWGAWKQPHPGVPVPVESVRRSERRSGLTELEGVTLTEPMRTCVDIMRRSREPDAVAIADAFLGAEYFGGGDLGDAVRALGNKRGVRVARTAAALARCGSESPGESRLRTVIVLGGLPEPEINVPFVTADGKHLGRPDLSYRDFRLPGYGRVTFGIEYDGAGHETPEARVRDLQRERRLRAAGVRLLRYTGDDVYGRPHLIRWEVRKALEGWWPRAHVP